MRLEMMKKTPFIAVLLLLSAVLLGGCLYQPVATGATATPAVTTSPVNVEPWELISKEEAEELTGNKELKDPLISPTASPGAYSGFVLCLYDTAVKGGRFLQISVLQTTQAMASQGVTPKMAFDTLRSPGPMYSPDPKLMVVQGVGDEAYILPPGMHIMYRGYYIVIGVGDPDDEASQAILINAGKKAVENLAAILGVPAPTESPTSAPQ
jgi:hypothetical protein